MAVPTIGAILYFVVFSDSVTGQVIYGIDKLFIVAYPALATWVVASRGRRVRAAGGSAGGAVSIDRRASLLWGLGSGLAVAGLVLFLFTETSLGDLVREGAPLVAAKAHGLGFAENFLLFAMFLSVVHSALEEYYWRWFVYGNLYHKKISGGVAHLVAAATFAAHHLVVTWQFFPPAAAVFFAFGVAVGGAIWSWIYRRTGSLLGPWLSHMIVDLALMWIGHGLLALSPAPSH